MDIFAVDSQRLHQGVTGRERGEPRKGSYADCKVVRVLQRKIEAPEIEAPPNTGS
jgi:hypothetical protein